MAGLIWECECGFTTHNEAVWIEHIRCGHAGFTNKTADKEYCPSSRNVSAPIDAIKQPEQYDPSEVLQRVAAYRSRHEINDTKSNYSDQSIDTTTTKAPDVGPQSTTSGEMGESSQRTIHELLEFKPGELTTEEEELVKRHGLNALNYIPRKILNQQAEAMQNYEARMRQRAEIMSRPETDPERIQMQRDEFAERLANGLRDRFDGFGYGLLLFVIFAIAFRIVDSHGWPIGIFSGFLMIAVLELSYQLSSRN